MIVSVQFIVLWEFKNAPHFKVTKCKKIINCKTNKIVKQKVRSSPGYWIDKKFIKRSELNSHLIIIPKNKNLPF
jgi:hypothetical protein